MKTTKSSLCSLLVLGGAFCAGVTIAEIPEPDAVIYGRVQHRFQEALTPSEAGQVTVLAKVNGAILAEYVLTPGTNAFLLRIPMDDGALPRLPNTAKAGDRVRFFLRNNETQTEFECLESYTTPWFLPAERAPLVPLDLTVEANVAGEAVDGNGNGIPDFWEARFGLDPARPANSDTDGDGVPDLEEFVAGTDPTDPASKFQVSLAADSAVPNQVQLTFAPAFSDRSYSVQISTSLGGGWSEQQLVRPAVSGQYTVTVPVTMNSGSVFLRVAVARAN